MSGPEMLLKSLGFDADALKAQAENFRAGAMSVVKHFDARLSVIEAKQDDILRELHANGKRVCSCHVGNTNNGSGCASSVGSGIECGASGSSDNNG